METELVKSGLNPALAQSVEPSPALYSYRNKMEYTFGNEYRMHLFRSAFTGAKVL